MLRWESMVTITLISLASSYRTTFAGLVATRRRATSEPSSEPLLRVDGEPPAHDLHRSFSWLKPGPGPLDRLRSGVNLPFSPTWASTVRLMVLDLTVLRDSSLALSVSSARCACRHSAGLHCKFALVTQSDFPWWTLSLAARRRTTAVHGFTHVVGSRSSSPTRHRRPQCRATGSSSSRPHRSARRPRRAGFEHRPCVRRRR